MGHEAGPCGPESPQRREFGPDGRLWGVADTGVFVVDPPTHAVELVTRSPEPVTAG